MIKYLGLGHYLGLCIYSSLHFWLQRYILQQNGCITRLGSDSNANTSTVVFQIVQRIFKRSALQGCAPNNLLIQTPAMNFRPQLDLKGQCTCSQIFKCCCHSRMFAPAGSMEDFQVVSFTGMSGVLR